MAIEKTLLLKGLAGVAALGGVGGVGGVVIKNKLDERAAEEKKKEDEQKNLEEINSKKKAKKEEVNGKLKTLGIEGCDLEDKDVTSPTVFSKNCELDQDKFSKIHFSNRGDNDVNVAGWTNGNINLKIENKEGGDNGIKFTFSGASSDLIISKSSTEQTDKFSIKANKETEFEENPKGKLSKKVNETLKGKLKGYNNKLGNLKLPETCRFDETEDEKKLECEIKGSELKTVNFTNKGTGQLTLKGLDDAGKIKLIIDREGSETDETLKYKFKNETSSKITLTGTEGDQTEFSIKASSETEFEEKPEGKLSKIISDQATSTKLNNYNTKFGNLSLPQTCRFDVTEPNTSLECEVTGSELKTVNFSNKGDGQLTLSGLNDSEKIKLIIEGDTASQTESLKYKFKNDKSSNITIIGKSGEQKKMVLKAGVETEFEKKDEKLSKIISNQETSTKLKGYNEKLEKLSLPDDCIFDVADTDTSLECDVTTTNITKIKFSNKETNDLTISDGSDFTGLKLNISGSGSNLKFIFKSGNKKIKLTNGSKHVFIKKDEESEFKIKDEALHKVLSSNVSELAKKVDLVCEYGDSGDGGTCKKDDNKSYLNVSKKTNPSDYEAIPIGNGSGSYEKDKVKFDFQEDQAGYEKGVKFTFTGETIEKSEVKLEKNVSYEIKKINEFDCLSKKVPQ